MAESKIIIPRVSDNPVEWTSYTFPSPFQQMDTEYSYVSVHGKICIFSLSFKYTSSGSTYTPADKAVFIENMPIPKGNVILSMSSYSGSDMKVGRAVINSSGQITNWYSGIKMYQYNPMVIKGAYIIAD